jgi:hypothetical protein
MPGLLNIFRNQRTTDIDTGQNGNSAPVDDKTERTTAALALALFEAVADIVDELRRRREEERADVIADKKTDKKKE